MQSKITYNAYLGAGNSARNLRKARDESSRSSSYVKEAAGRIVSASKVPGIQNVASALDGINRNRYNRIESIASAGDVIKDRLYSKYKEQEEKERQEQGGSRPIWN